MKHATLLTMITLLRDGSEVFGWTLRNTVVCHGRLCIVAVLEKPQPFILVSCPARASTVHDGCFAASYSRKPSACVTGRRTVCRRSLR